VSMGFNFLGTRRAAAGAAVSANEVSSRAPACLSRRRWKAETRVEAPTSEQAAQLDAWEDEGGTPAALPSPQLEQRIDDDVAG